MRAWIKDFVSIYKVPGSLKKLPYSTYLELIEIPTSDENTYSALLDAQIERLSILTGKSIDEVERMSPGLFKWFLVKTNYLSTEPEFKQIEFDLNQVTIGQMVDAEQWLLNPNKYLYANEIVERIYNVKTDSTLEILSYFKHFLQWRENLYTKRFAVLFQPDSGNDINTQEEMSNSERRKQEAFERQKQQWNWYEFVYNLCQGDILKMEQIEKVNFIQALLFKAYERFKADEEKIYSR